MIRVRETCLDTIERGLRNGVLLCLARHLEHEHNKIGKIVPLLHNGIHAVSTCVAKINKNTCHTVFEKGKSRSNATHSERSGSWSV